MSKYEIWKFVYFFSLVGVLNKIVLVSFFNFKNNVGNMNKKMISEIIFFLTYISRFLKEFLENGDIELSVISRNQS